MYMPITQNREFIMINNIPVCTFKFDELNLFINEHKKIGRPLNVVFQ